jgi:very-short-patch-repair endonuclease
LLHALRVPNPLYRPQGLQYQLFRGSQAIDELVLTANQLRGPAWVRLGHDVYADSRVDRDHHLACRAIAMRVPEYVAFAGPSAAYLLGVTHAAGFRDPVHVVVDSEMQLESSRGLVVHHVALATGDIASRDGLLVTCPTRTAWDLACWLDPVRSVPILDGMLGQGLVSFEALDQYLRTKRPRRGRHRVEHAISLADGRAQSPQESRLRVLLVQAGLPKPEGQYPVPVGSLTLHPDLAWPEYKVAAEYDGEWHEAPAQAALDLERLRLLARAGWIVVPVTRDRMRDFPALVAEIRGALRSRGANV